jgi:lipoate-protein ligase A
MPDRVISVVRTGFSDRDGLDTAVARALLTRASEGRLDETFRIHRPARIVAFGKHDTLEPGHEDAVRAAVRRGFAPVLRLAGGRAAVFHENTLAFSWTVPDPDPTRGIRDRFETVAGLMVRAFARLGINSQIGEVPGEYCPGEFSVSLGGRVKVMGVGQRLARRAAHIGGVVVVSDGDLVRSVLVPVYEALGIPWLPDTAGSLADASPAVAPDAVTNAIVSELGGVANTVDGRIDAETRHLAEGFLPDHLLTTTAGSPW